ncbi:MAG: acetyl/propionyl/methylcrotonyl-CoA carboxylase subunit alpha [Pseudomonadota bacterium]
MFTKILIANRGEIACRVAATARRLGVQTVMVYSDADAHALHVRSGDEAVGIGPASAAESYLNTARILQAAHDTGAQAIHPGYGFLSENADFAQACADAGLMFIGPPPSAIRAMGLKAESKRLMHAAGVPLVPGYHEADQDPARLQQAADAIGYPVLIKASAGGGGKGMRVVTEPAAFAEALASCQREARSSFGNDAVLIERYLTRPRHIEVQVFGDRHGQVVSLFERDCSVQRRHQKVLEEAPAPGLDDALRERMGQAAMAAARAVGYVGAGTVEFIAEPGPQPGDMAFYFMEMNTRLQVEHPVTEAITGQDLVEWQLRVAAGEPLPCTADQLRRRGHAIEARICAENPEAQFLPATGHLSVCRWPAATRFTPGEVRLDTGVQEGDTVSPHYDAMLAKLIVWGETRAHALARLEWALARTHLVGPHTNVAFLRRVVASRSFAQADLDTALIERERAALFGAPALAVPWVVAGVVAQALAAASPLPSGEPAWVDPWADAQGWRLQGEAQWHWTLDVGGQRVRASLSRARSGGARLQCDVEGVSHAPQAWRATPCGDGVFELHLDQASCRVTVYPSPGSAAGQEATGWAVFSAEAQGQAQVRLPWAEADSAAAGSLCAPMPGKVLLVLVCAGERVQRGQALAVMEAMKMEHTLHAPADGLVRECLYAVGDQVVEGAELLRLDPLPVAMATTG